MDRSKQIIGDGVRQRPRPDQPTLRMRAAIVEFAGQYGLTCRETDVLKEVCTGLKNDAIATRLGLSPATVRLHLSGIYRKTAVADKPELILAVWLLSLQPGRRNRRGRPKEEWSYPHR
jgi:DNA-binding NarL/FixJ family response regulator